MAKPESFSRRVLHLADQWPETQRLIDVAVDGKYRCGCGGSGRVTENARDHREGGVNSQHFHTGRGPLAGSSAGKPRKVTAVLKHKQEYGGVKENVDRERQSPSST